MCWDVIVIGHLQHGVHFYEVHQRVHVQDWQVWGWVFVVVKGTLCRGGGGLGFRGAVAAWEWSLGDT